MTGAEPAPDPIVRRPGDARRRLFLIDLDDGGASEVGPPDLSVWEVAWDGDTAVVALVSSDHSGSGWYQATVARLDLTARTAVTLYEPAWQLEGLELAPDAGSVAVVEGYASDHGLLSGSLRIIDLASGGTTDPWPDLQTVGLASWADADSLWYATYRRHRQRVRPHLARRAPRGAVARRRVHRRRDHDSGVRDHPRRRRRLDNASSTWRRTGARTVRSHDGCLDARDLVQRPHRRGPHLPRRAYRPMDRARPASRSRGS